MPYTQFDPHHPPPPLMTGEQGSFAYKTMTTRIPNIVQQTLADHAEAYPPALKDNLESLHQEISGNELVRPLQTTASDGPAWAEAWQPHQGRRWLEIPWYFAESFFYRRLLEAVYYFGGPDETLNRWRGQDPFLPRKEEELAGDTPWQVVSAAISQADQDRPEALAALLHYCVWGNRVDLSYNQVSQETGRGIAVEQEQANLLVDDTGAVVAHLAQRRGEPTARISLERAEPLATPTTSRIDFICDNAGTELLLDLALADFLLRFDWAGQVTLHVKAHPTFVSDATPADIEMSLVWLDNEELELANLLSLAARLERFRAERRLQVRPHLFWNSSQFFWELPPDLQFELSRPHLLIFKGDANYRRLLGDSRWPTTVPAAQAIPYLPAPFVALRTMKSEPVVGLQPGQAKTLDQLDPEWRVNGKRGMIQALL